MGKRSVESLKNMESESQVTCAFHKLDPRSARSALDPRCDCQACPPGCRRGRGIGAHVKQCAIGEKAAAFKSGCLRSETTVIMMETADLWYGGHFAHRRRMNGTRFRCVLPERQMSPAGMIVVDVLS